MKMEQNETLLILVRHGQSEGNVDHTVYARKKNVDIALTKQGREESRAIGRKIANLLRQFESGDRPISLKLNFDEMTFVSSPYLRTRQTLLEIFDVLNLLGYCHISEELLCSEQGWGEAEGTAGYDDYIESLRGKTYIENQQGGTNRETYEREKHLREVLDHLAYRPTRGENLMDVYIRAGLFLEKFRWFTKDKVAIISAHKGFLTMLHYYLLGGLPSVTEFPMLGLVGTANTEHTHEKAGWKNGDARVYRLTPNKRHRAQFGCELIRDLDS